MKTYYYIYKEETNDNDPRFHPWNYAESNPTHRYYDFKLKPHLISEVLEDFQSWDNELSIKMFYHLLTWLNGTTSSLESNDSAFRGPRKNMNTNFSKTLECEGRLMILNRNIIFNTSKQHIKWLHNAICYHLDRIDKSFEWGVVRTAIRPVQYISLPIDEQNGEQIELIFWVWGDNNKEIFLNLGRTFCVICKSLYCVSQEILENIAI